MKVVNGVQLVSLDVTAPQWVTIQKALIKLPYEDVAPILAQLSQQILEQSKSAEETAS